MDEDQEMSACAASLVEALELEPFYAAITRDFEGDHARRREVLRRYFEYSMKEGRSLWRCTVLPDEPIGAAVWLKGVPHERSVESGREKHMFLGSLLGPMGLADYHRIIAYMSARSEQAVGGDAWYLSILGVSPRAQGKGIGRRLLEPTLSEADREAADCYLETFSPRNIPFYERLGFRRVVSHVEPVTASEYWIMVRKPVRR